MLAKGVAERPAQERRPASVCIATRELLGRGEPTEAAGAIAALAQELAQCGDQVTLLWSPSGEFQDSADIESIRKYYFDNHLVRLEILSKSDRILPVLWTPEQRSLALYHHLKERDFDQVYIALESGLAYYALLGVETGVFRPRSAISVVATSPLEWLAESDRYFLRDFEQVTIAHMERYCAEHAQHLICTTSSVTEWMRARGWAVPADIFTLAAMPPEEWRGHSWNADPIQHGPIDEIVLLAGPNFREGQTLFCDVVDELAKRKAPPHLKITAFGPFGQILGEHTGGMLLRRARRWPFELHIIPNMGFSERLAYIRRKKALAVVPCHESATGFWVSACLESKVCFVAAAVAAHVDLIAKASRRNCLAEPNSKAMADAIARAVKKSVLPAPRTTEEDRRQEWVSLHERLTERADEPKTIVDGRQKMPLVSVVIVHHDRPHYLLQAVESVENQSYQNIEVILVDDGSEHPDSLAALEGLEEKFRSRDWKILRQDNKYLGAARNLGVRSSSGERILFLDDDNALLPEAVETYVEAMDACGADICTAFQLLFYEEFIPQDQRLGLIQYIPLGGSLDLGLIHDSFGDANAMVRRSVFDKIGYQYEEYGYTANDWEFFARACLAGLKLRIIPEPLYWYRSSAQGMYRTSHWYDNRLPILAAYRKHSFRGLEHVFHLLLSAHATKTEQEGFRENLRYSASDEGYLRLCDLRPNSAEALDLMAQLAAAEGRFDTALALLGHGATSDFRSRVARLKDLISPDQQALLELAVPVSDAVPLDYRELLRFTSVGCNAREQPLFYLEEPDRLFLQPSDGQPAIAVMTAGCLAGTMGVSARVQLGHEAAAPCEFMLMASSPHADARLAIAGAATGNGNQNTGWCRVSRPDEPREISVYFDLPSRQSKNLLIAVRPAGGISPRGALGCFDKITLWRTHPLPDRQRPRRGAPPFGQRARTLDENGMKGAKLLTSFKSDLPELLVAPNGGGIFLRPNRSGTVAAVLPWVFPPFALEAIAKVEIAHEEAGPFQFAMALSRPDEALGWAGEHPANALGFSGWVTVAETFKLHDVAVRLPARTKTALSLNIAIRLAPGAAEAPANSFWRKFVFLWDE